MTAPTTKKPLNSHKALEAMRVLHANLLKGGATDHIPVVAVEIERLTKVVAALDKRKSEPKRLVPDETARFTKLARHQRAMPDKHAVLNRMQALCKEIKDAKSRQRFQDFIDLVRDADYYQTPAGVFTTVHDGYTLRISGPWESAFDAMIDASVMIARAKPPR